MHSGSPALMIRKIYTNKQEISDMVEKILENGAYEFNGVVIFRNPILAISHLYNLGLVDINLSEIYTPDFSPKKNKNTNK